jgi:hypothetical protein
MMGDQLTWKSYVQLAQAETIVAENVEAEKAADLLENAIRNLKRALQMLKSE